MIAAYDDRWLFVASPPWENAQCHYDIGVRRLLVQRGLCRQGHCLFIYMVNFKLYFIPKPSALLWSSWPKAVALPSQTPTEDYSFAFKLSSPRGNLDKGSEEGTQRRPIFISWGSHQKKSSMACSGQWLCNMHQQTAPLTRRTPGMRLVYPSIKDFSQLKPGCKFFRCLLYLLQSLNGFRQQSGGAASHTGRGQYTEHLSIALPGRAKHATDPTRATYKERLQFIAVIRPRRGCKAFLQLTRA